MKLLFAPTEPFIKLDRTTLAEDVDAGSDVTLTLENNNGFTENDYIVIGHEGNELAELQQVNAGVSGHITVRVATLKFNHKAGEPVVRFRYNQRKFYGSSSDTGSFTELTADGSPKDIQVDDPQGTALEYTGNEGYTYFKATYFNSTASTETSLDDAEAVLADESLRYASIYAIRKHAGLTGNPYYSDLRLEVKRRQAENEINSVIAATYRLPLSEVPALLSQICELLAAGYIDFEEFGADGEGKKWLGEARSLLKALQEGKRLLIGQDGQELQRNGSVGRLSGFPDHADAAERKFRINDVY